MISVCKHAVASAGSSNSEHVIVASLLFHSFNTDDR